MRLDNYILLQTNGSILKHLMDAKQLWKLVENGFYDRVNLGPVICYGVTIWEKEVV